MSALNSVSKNVRISWPEASSEKQIFSVPSDVICYMMKDLSCPTTYLKLAKSCKYFFEKEPILIVYNVFDGGKTICAKNAYDQCKTKKRKCCVEIDPDKIKSKIWLTGKLEASQMFGLSALSLSSKIYQKNTAVLYIRSSFIYFKNFKIWATTFQNFCFVGYRMFDESNRNNVMLDGILNSIPNVQSFYHVFYNVADQATPETMKKITNLKNLNNLRRFHLENIPEVVNIDDLTTFIKDNKNIEFYLSFSLDISDGYKNQLDKLVDTVIEEEICDCVISYEGQHGEKYEIMKKRFYCC